MREKHEPSVGDSAQGGACQELRKCKERCCFLPLILLPVCLRLCFSLPFFFKQSPGVESDSQPQSCLLPGSPLLLWPGLTQGCTGTAGSGLAPQPIPQKCPPHHQPHSHMVPQEGWATVKGGR